MGTKAQKVHWTPLRHPDDPLRNFAACGERAPKYVDVRIDTVTCSTCLREAAKVHPPLGAVLPALAPKTQRDH